MSTWQILAVVFIALNVLGIHQNGPGHSNHGGMMFLHASAVVAGVIVMFYERKK